MKVFLNGEDPLRLTQLFLQLLLREEREVLYVNSQTKIDPATPETVDSVRKITCKMLKLTEKKKILHLV